MRRSHTPNRIKEQSLLRLATGPHDTRCLAFDRQGRRLATGGNGPRVTVWDLADGRALLNVTADRKGVEDVCFSPDGKRLATGGWESTVRVWEMETGQEVQNLAGHRKMVTRVCFSADGRHLASGALDGTVRLWPAASPEEQLLAWLYQLVERPGRLARQLGPERLAALEAFLLRCEGQILLVP